MTMDQLSFEEKMRVAMLRKKITYTDIANELNISVAYVSDIVKGNRDGGKYKKTIAEMAGIKDSEI